MILRRMFSKNEAKVKGDNNLTIQSSQVDNVNINVNGLNEIIPLMAKCRKYDEVQDFVGNLLSSLKTTHPLYPYYSATYSAKLEKLISTPETKEALELYPKKIKGVYEIDYKKYPNMDKSEMPWEYAYRTQTTVELKTKAHQEYLGDNEDPYPIVKHHEGMMTIIAPPEFPEAIEIQVVSKNIIIPVMLRRLPCMEFGKLVFGNVTNEQGFNIKLTLNEIERRTNITFTKINGMKLETQLCREKLFESIYNNREVAIRVNGKDIVVFNVEEKDVQDAIFQNADFWVRYIGALISIENKLGCKFDVDFDEVTVNDYFNAMIMSASLNEKWQNIIMSFDNSIRCDYDKIPEDIVTYVDDAYGLVGEVENPEFSIQGVDFKADKYIVQYTEAKINNIDAIKKNIKRKKKKILVTMKPIEGKEKFNKHARFEGLREDVSQ